LDCRLRLVPEHHVEQVLKNSPDGYWLSESRLCLDQPLAFQGTIDMAGMGLLARCDGNHRLGDLVRDLAREHELDMNEAVASCLAPIHKLMLLGFLVPV
jgi:hypothetical protein